jgi:hypothetical protein
MKVELMRAAKQSSRKEKKVLTIEKITPEK